MHSRPLGDVKPHGGLDFEVIRIQRRRTRDRPEIDQRGVEREERVAVKALHVLDVARRPEVFLAWYFVGGARGHEDDHRRDGAPQVRDPALWRRRPRMSRPGAMNEWRRARTAHTDGAPGGEGVPPAPGRTEVGEDASSAGVSRRRGGRHSNVRCHVAIGGVGAGGGRGHGEDSTIGRLQAAATRRAVGVRASQGAAPWASMGWSWPTKPDGPDAAVGRATAHYPPGQYDNCTVARRSRSAASV